MNDWQSARTRARGYIDIDVSTKSLRPLLVTCTAIVMICVGMLAMELL